MDKSDWTKWTPEKRMEACMDEALKIIEATEPNKNPPKLTMSAEVIMTLVVESGKTRIDLAKSLYEIHAKANGWA